MNSNYYVNQWAKFINESTVDDILNNSDGVPEADGAGSPVYVGDEGTCYVQDGHFVWFD